MDKIIFNYESVDYNGWTGDLIMCPSQITKNLKDEYYFYLRWRWDDPWLIYICSEKDEQLFLELNAKYSLYFIHDNWKKLCDKLDELVETILLDIK